MVKLLVDVEFFIYPWPQHLHVNIGNTLSNYFHNGRVNNEHDDCYSPI